MTSVPADCASCADDTVLPTVVSRHRTAEGWLSYAKCQCGRWTVWREPLVHGPALRCATVRG